MRCGFTAFATRGRTRQPVVLMAEERILPPFPDELVTAAIKEDAIRFLLELGLPGRIAAAHLTRWGAMTDVSISGNDFRRVRSGRGGRP